MPSPHFPFPSNPTGWYHLADARDVTRGAAPRAGALGASLARRRPHFYA
ncbi:MAG: hypothetical protein MUF70_10510 [Myxococcota bacterium]|nr:hypothetical protein [Myxococcota bacterium]